MESEAYGRDVTCPAGNSTVPGIISRAGACVIGSGARAGRNGSAAIRKVLERIPRAHAGKMLLTGMQPGLPVRLVKKIDQYATKIIRDSLRRYYL